MLSIDVQRNICETLNRNDWLIQKRYLALPEDKADLDAELLARLQQSGGDGTAIMVSGIGFVNEAGSAPTPVGPLTISAVVTEHPALNREHPDFASSLEAAFHLATLLHYTQVGDDVVTLKSIAPGATPGLISWKVTFEMQHALKVTEDQ